MRDYSGIVMQLRLLAADLETAYGEERGSSLYSAAADAIEELLAKVPHWISVEDELPDVATKVLTYNGDYVSENWMCTIIDKDGRRVIWAYSEKFVTHWMPLPAPPKGVE